MKIYAKKYQTGDFLVFIIFSDPVSLTIQTNDSKVKIHKDGYRPCQRISTHR